MLPVAVTRRLPGLENREIFFEKTDIRDWFGTEGSEVQILSPPTKSTKILGNLQSSVGQVARFLCTNRASRTERSVLQTLAAC